MHFHKIRHQICSLMAALGLTISSSALANDLSNGAPDGFVATAVDHWKGPYAGLHIGATGGGGLIDKGAGFDEFKHVEGSAQLGGHVGYNFGRFGGAANGGWMIGAEIDISTAGFDSRETDPVLGSSELDGSFLASTRLRVGYAWDSVFLYGTAGIGLSDITLKPENSKDDGTEISAGFAYGLGVEFVVAEQWRARIEAIGYNFGERDYKFNGVDRNVELGMGTVRLGLSRPFHIE